MAVERKCSIRMVIREFGLRNFPLLLHLCASFFFFGGQQAIRLNHYEWHIHALRLLHNEFIFQYAVGYGRSFGGGVVATVTGTHPSTVRIWAFHDPRTMN